MSLKKLFRRFSKNDSDLHQLAERIAKLEERVGNTDKQARSPERKSSLKSSTSLPVQPPLIVEHLNVERLIVDKFELNNNFGQLGIKELKGRMNIGATYGEGFPVTFGPEEGESQEQPIGGQNQGTQPEDGPKVHIRGKPKQPQAE